MKYRLVGLLSLGHLATDINQGALPALLPFFISEHHLSYKAAAGLVFAASIASSVVQPLFGHFADRLSKPWLMPTGLLLAGIGLAFTGIVPNYRMIVLAVVVSGIGIAAFHPEGARLVNYVGGEKKATAMSMFAVGGSLGFAIGPLIATTALISWGLKGTLILIVPMTIMVIILVGQLSRFPMGGRNLKEKKAGPTIEIAQDAWGPFTRLTATVICRSILFYGLNTFLPLYWINVLHQSNATAGTALTILFMAGVIGTLLGGRLADYLGHRRVLLIGFVTLIPLLPILISVSDESMATVLLVPIGLVLFAIYSPMVVMGQKYLPNRIGLASGVTLGVAVAIGGVASPLLGWIADHHGIRAALMGVVFLPVLAAGLTLTLPDPKILLKQGSIL
jgi:MFS transporter, FSR family, fosmidomycin resistance protein